MSVSIIMPFYKKKKFVKASVDSILNQTYSDFEIILIYDDEDLNDYEYIKDLENKDPRIKVIKNKMNLGAGLSRNIGIKNSKNELIAFLDCDDIWEKNKLSDQIKFMTENKYEISFTSYDIIDHRDRRIGIRMAKKYLTFDDLIKSCDIGLSTVMIKKNLFDDECKFVSLVTKEDYVLWLNLAKKNVKFYGLERSLTKWRKLDNSLSSNVFQKLYDGFKVYNEHMKFNKVISIIYLIRLSINYLLKK